MSTIPTPKNVAEALQMLRAGMGYLAAADATDMVVDEQAQCLQVMELMKAMGTAAHAWTLAAFIAAQGHHEDGCYSPKSWLINHLGITKAAATAYLSWARRAASHPRVLTALAARDISESVARTICDWTGLLPPDCQDAADAILVAAAVSGASLADLARLAAEIYARSRPPDPDGPDGGFGDRSVRLETTFEGAGVLGGDLTPECAAVVGAVLDALSAPAGAGDLRTHGQRYHDALQDAMQRLLAAGLLPGAGRAAGPRVGAHVAGGAARPGRRRGPARAVDRRGPGPVGRAPRRRLGRRRRGRLAGRRRRRRGRLRRPDQPGRDRRRGPGRPGRAGPALRGTVPARPRHQPGRGPGRRGPTTRTDRPPRPPRRPVCRGRRSSGRSSARPWSCCPARAGSRRFLRRQQLGATLAGPSLPLDIGYSDTVPAAIRHAVTLRDQHCRWAGGCSQPAGACQVHHVRHKANGGPTSVKDCMLLCFFHHQVVIHRWGWTLVLNPDGTTTAWNPDRTKVLHSHSPPARAG